MASVRASLAGIFRRGAAVPGVQDERTQTMRAAALSGGHAAHDNYMGFLSPLLPVFISNLALSKFEAGVLTVFTQGPSLLQPVIGYLADRAGLRYVAILGPAVTATAMSLLGIAPNYLTLVMLLLVAGFSSAAFHSVASAISGDLLQRRLGRGMSLWMVGGQFGAAVGPLMIVTALRVLPLTGTPVLMVGGWLVSLFLYLQLRDLPLKARQVGPGVPWLRAVRGMGPLLAPLGGVLLGRSFLDAALYVFMPTFLTEQGVSLWLAGGALTLLETAGVVGVIAAGPISDRVGRRPVLWTCLVLAPLMMLGFLATTGPLQMPFFVLVGLLHAAITPVVMAVVMESFPANRALAAGIYMALLFASRPLAVVILGALGDLFSLRVGFTASAVFGLIALPLLLLLPRVQVTDPGTGAPSV